MAKTCRSIGGRQICNGPRTDWWKESIGIDWTSPAPEPDPNLLIHFVVLGQSQAGGYNNAPALTTVGDVDITTLTDGPVDVDVEGDLITCVEGDTFSATGGPAATPNIETIATSFAQQLKVFAGGGRYCATVHATGGTTIQALSLGGSSGRFEEAIDAIARVKAIADTNGWTYNCHLIFFHGGTGDNVGDTYKNKVIALYDDFLAAVKPTYTGQDQVYMFTHQQRPIGTPDYGIQQYEASKDNPNIIVIGPEYTTTYQGDGIHITNHGTRYLAMLWSRAVNRKLFGSGFLPLELDIDNASFDGTDTITVPVLNAIGALSGTSNYGIEVFNNTTSAVIASTATIDGGDINVTLGAVPVGEHDLTIRTGLTANGLLHDSSGAVDVPSFNNASAQPYDTDKYMVRAEYDVTVFFPVNLILNFGGVAADPEVSGTISIWRQLKSAVDVDMGDISDGGGVHFIFKNTASNYWGFTTTQDQISGNNAVTGANLFDNDVVANFWFVENKFGEGRINGLNPSKLYTMTLAGMRITATTRITIFTIGATSIIRVTNNSSGDSPLNDPAQLAVFSDLSPDGVDNGITFRVEDDDTQFGYLCVCQIEEQ